MKKLTLIAALVAGLAACSPVGEPSSDVPGAREVTIGNINKDGVDGNDPRWGFAALLAALAFVL